MNAKYLRERYASTINEANYAIDQAARGLLSPYWQVEAKEALRAEYNGASVPNDMLDSLCTKLEAAIQSRPQITDVDAVRQEVEGRGDKLWLCFRNTDHNTMMEIIEGQHGTCTAVVYIDAGASAGRLEDYAAMMVAAMNQWIEKNGIQVAACRGNPDKTESDIEQFCSVGEAAGWILHRLQVPGDILC